jgi:chromosome segregation ATPase
MSDEELIAHNQSLIERFNQDIVNEQQTQANITNTINATNEAIAVYQAQLADLNTQFAQSVTRVEDAEYDIAATESTIIRIQSGLNS